jgi:hypothetical protein
MRDQGDDHGHEAEHHGQDVVRPALSHCDILAPESFR